MAMNMPAEYQEQRIEYVPKVEVTLEQAVDNLKKLDQIRQRIMRQGVDYDVIPGTPKPTLLKPGAERLLQFFGLGHKIQLVDKKEDWDNGFFYYQYKVTIVKQYPGYEIIVAECEGSANSKERRYRNQDVFSIVNTLQKMAIKRALVGATLQATGTSGMFTQDLDDTDIAPDVAKPTAHTQKQSNDKVNGKATDAQKKAIRAIAKEAGVVDDDDTLAYILSTTGMQVNNLEELTKVQASDIITALNKAKKAAQNA